MTILNDDDALEIAKIVGGVVTTENRATMKAYRAGLTLEEYLEDMWKRREAEHPCKTESQGIWPMLRDAQSALPTLHEQSAASVTNIKKAARS